VLKTGQIPIARRELVFFPRVRFPHRTLALSGRALASVCVGAGKWAFTSPRRRLLAFDFSGLSGPGLLKGQCED